MRYTLYKDYVVNSLTIHNVPYTRSHISGKEEEILRGSVASYIIRIISYMKFRGLTEMDYNEFVEEYHKT